MVPWLVSPFSPGTDATATIALTESGVVGSAAAGDYALATTAVEGSAFVLSRSSRTTFWLDAAGRYGAALAKTPGVTFPNDMSARGEARLGWTASPRTGTFFVVNGLVASRLGMRASDDLAVRDPFLQNRVVYGAGTRLGLFTATSPTGTARVEATYAQAGAISADSPDAVGIDSHAVQSSLSYVHQATARLRIGPMVRLGFTHYEHALLDVDLRRGQADVASAALLGTATYEVTPRILGTFRLGATAARGPSGDALAPEARAEARLLGRRYRATLSYGHTYGSLGPRIGFGREHAASLDLWGRPREGAAGRETLGHVIVRFRRGTAPIGGGALTTTGVAAGASMVWPMRLGWLVGAGVDVERVTAEITPVVANHEPAPAFRAMLTISVTAIGSTDPARRLPRNPGLDVGQGDERMAPALDVPPHPKDVDDEPEPVPDED